MNVMTKAVLFLLLVVFINDVLAFIHPPSWNTFPYYNYKRRILKVPKENVDDRTKKLICRGSNTIKGLNGDWKFHCSHNPKCTRKSNYLSRGVAKTPTGKINHICKGYIRGITYYSRGDNDGFDRKFGITCCRGNQKAYHEDCYWTGWQNCFGSSFKFWVPDGYYMAGIRSEYNSSVKNGYPRIWDFYLCK